MEVRVIRLSVNGKSVSIDADANMPLLWVLRDEIGLKGTKFGCGVAQCGACTVHLDGKPVRSCVTPVGSVGNRRVTTVEGLTSTPQGQAVRAAWETIDVAQCGYCQAGQMMAAAGLLAGNPRPSDADIDAAMQGNFCRCSTYKRIRAAIKTAAGIDPADRRAG
jgi:isoquinoline 1-oxidoreductase subunit alpha